jgi:hypothetical protein
MPAEPPSGAENGAAGTTGRPVASAGEGCAMLASMAFVLGVVVGIVLLATVGRAPGTAPELGGWALALGVLAAVGFVATGLVQGASFIAPLAGLASIALAAATVLVGIGGLLRGARGWPTWVGLVLGGAPALLWIAFLFGNLL